MGAANLKDFHLTRIRTGAATLRLVLKYSISHGDMKFCMVKLGCKQKVCQVQKNNRKNIFAKTLDTRAKIMI